jgi:adenosylhomocysteine nucleosidase
MTTENRIATIAVLGALDEEIDLLARHLSDVKNVKEAGLTVTTGTVVTNRGNTVRVVATVAGMGTVAAAAATQHLITKYSPVAVLFSGIAGSLNKDLHIDDVVLGGTLRYLDSDMELISASNPEVKEYHSDPRLIRIAEQALEEQGTKYIIGVIASGNHFVAGDELTASVKEQTGADAVEMEGAAVLHVALKNKVPALVIRALSDNADTEYESFRHFDISRFADTASELVLAILKRM